MRHLCRALIIFCGAGLSFSLLAAGQDSQSLGDAARQARQQKQAKPAHTPNKNAPPVRAAKVITNDEIPAHLTPAKKTIALNQEPEGDHREPREDDKEQGTAVDWKSHIESKKTLVNSLQSQIDQVSESIHFAPANCVSNCVQWNERQREKQQQLEQMKSQLDEAHRRLEDLQEQARKLGYGSSIYDP